MGCADDSYGGVCGNDDVNDEMRDVSRYTAGIERVKKR